MPQPPLEACTECGENSCGLVDYKGAITSVVDSHLSIYILNNMVEVLMGGYFDADVTLLRLIWMLIVVFTGIFPGVIVYIFASLIMPKERVRPAVDDIDEANEEYKKIV